jgi:phage repressor protein C with HTH and peptisase S24 domain
MAPTRTPTPKTTGERLKAARGALGVSQAQMGTDVGLPQTTLADYELDKYELPHHLALAIEYRFGISRQWLLDGAGEMFLESTPQPGSPNGGIVRRHGIATRPIIVTNKSELQRLDQLEGRDRYYAVPYLRDAAAAGSGRIVEDAIEGYCVIHERVAPQPENLRCVRVSGDSMEPALTDGSIVAVDITRRNPRELEGRIVCARISDDEVVIKRLRLRGQYALLFSDNEDQHKYPTLVVDLRENRELVIGQVIWAWVDLR